jgi:hypothetical protein
MFGGNKCSITQSQTRRSDLFVLRGLVQPLFLQTVKEEDHDKRKSKRR